MYLSKKNTCFCLAYICPRITSQRVFLKFQNFPGRQATGPPPPPPPKGIFQSNSLCLLHKHNSIQLPSQFRLYIYLMTALNFLKKFQNYLQNFMVVDMTNSMISFFFLYLFQSVHKAFRSFSVFCHGLLAGCHRLKWLLNNMLAQVMIGISFLQYHT